MVHGKDTGVCLLKVTLVLFLLFICLVLSFTLKWSYTKLSLIVFWQFWIKANIKDNSSKVADIKNHFSFWAEAIIGLAFQSDPVKEGNIPETLYWDLHRLSSAQLEIHFITQSASMITAVSDWLKTYALEVSSWKGSLVVFCFHSKVAVVLLGCWVVQWLTFIQLLSPGWSQVRHYEVHKWDFQGLLHTLPYSSHA